MRAFISYSVEEKRFGVEVKQTLKNLGIQCFMAHQDIKVSEEWKARIIEELQTADIFVTLLSAKFKASDWCSQELGYILSRPEVVIVPLSIDHTNPYGFISHIQGQYVSDESAISGIIEDLLFRKRPRDMIPIQIERVRVAGGYRIAEAAVKPLVPHFGIFTEQEAADFASAAVGNYEVWDAGLCRSEYLPEFLAINGKRIPDALKKELSEKIGILTPSPKPELSKPSLLGKLKKKKKKKKKKTVRFVPELPVNESAMSEQNKKPPLPEAQVKILKFLNKCVVPVPPKELCKEIELPEAIVGLNATLLRDRGWLEFKQITPYAHHTENNIGYVLTLEGRQKASEL